MRKRILIVIICTLVLLMTGCAENNSKNQGTYNISTTSNVSEETTTSSVLSDKTNLIGRCRIVDRQVDLDGYETVKLQAQYGDDICEVAIPETNSEWIDVGSDSGNISSLSEFEDGSDIPYEVKGFSKNVGVTYSYVDYKQTDYNFDALVSYLIEQERKGIEAAKNFSEVEMFDDLNGNDTKLFQYNYLCDNKFVGLERDCKVYRFDKIANSTILITELSYSNVYKDEMSETELKSYIETFSKAAGIYFDFLEGEKQ